MKKKLILCFSALLVAILPVACHLVSSTEPVVTIHDTGKTLYVNTGDLFKVILDSNPTTGYSWEIGPYDDSIIKFVKSEYKPSSDRIGSDGKRIIKFEAFNKGKTTLELSYLLVWEKNKEPIKKLEITVAVE